MHFSSGTVLAKHETIILSRLDVCVPQPGEARTGMGPGGGASGSWVGRGGKNIGGSFSDNGFYFWWLVTIKDFLCGTSEQHLSGVKTHASRLVL